MVEFHDGSTSPSSVRRASRAHRAGVVVARAARGRRRAVRLEPGADLGVPAARRRRLPGRAARPAGRVAGGTYPAVYNAANEVCVDAFHDGTIRFTDIVDTIERVVDAHAGQEGDAHSLEGVLAADAWARDEAARVLGVSR